MPATEMSPHGLLIAPARVQPASIRSLGAVRGRGARRLVESSWATGALALSAAALATVAAAAAEPFAALVAIAAGWRHLDPKWFTSDGRHSRASASLVGALAPPKRSGNGT